MKVLIIHTTYKYRGGEDTVVFEEMRLLKSYGLTVELLAFDNESSSLLKILKLPFNLQSYKAAKIKLQTYKPDIVHIHNLHFAGSPSVLYALKKSNVPFVTTLHNFRLICPSAILFHKGKLFLDSINQKFPWKAVVNGVYKNSVLLTFWLGASSYLHNKIGTYKLSNKYIVLNDHAKSLFLKSSLNFNKNQFLVKPNFCYDSLFKPPSVSDYFLYVGRLSEEKGIQLMLKAFASLGYKVKIAGDGPLKEEVLKSSDANANIEFLGVKSKENVFRLMQSCTALIFPSVWFEGMPLTIIEAFSCATPVIASRLGAMETMIIDSYNGLHFEPEDENDLKSKLTVWQKMSQKERNVYRQNARKTYEKSYTPARNAEQLLNIYTSVIEEARPSVLSVYQ